MDKFLERHGLPKLTQEKTKSEQPCKEIELVKKTKNILTIRNHPDDFTS